jgi:sterol desaturase/sphingolipid hydroxylase (fatty acid hydroxylase superfamily)
VLLKIGFWKYKKHHLDKMTLGELTKAYFQYYAIQMYIAVAIGGFAYAFASGAPLAPLALTAAVSALAYPLAWYLIHRYVLHGNWLAKSPLTAQLWKRIHFDHHQDPHDLHILFGALYNTLPTIASVTIPIGYVIAGWPGVAMGLAMGCTITCFYEFCHCIEHLSYKPKNKILLNMKQRHMAHHFHSERGNFGITNFFWDRVFGTLYSNENRPPKSATVYNLGYDEAMAERYPWVSDLSGGVSNDSPRERRQQAA